VGGGRAVIPDRPSGGYNKGIMLAPRRVRCRIVSLSIGVTLIALAATAAGQIVLPPGLGQPGEAQNVPSPTYDLALESLDDGDYTAALAAATAEYQRGVKIGLQRWIDSIASAAIVGECQFELGALRDAVTAYEESMVMAATQGDWLLAVQFPQQPLRTAAGRAAPWGRSTRNTLPAIVPPTMTIRRGGEDPEQVLKKGGTLVAPADYPIRPEEIMRSLVIAIYRHADILGELSRESVALAGVTRTLARRPAPANHYSQSWISIALGTALWSMGKPDQAQPLLEGGLLAGDGLDHGLTAWGLIVLGRIALDAGRPEVAAKLFEEATYSAADSTDGRALEEAFRLAFMAHMEAGTRGVPPTIRAGCEWARGNLPVLRVMLLGMQAEALVIAGDRQTAAASLKAIDGRLRQSDPGRGRAGAQAAYATALVEYASGDVTAGDVALDTSLRIAALRSARLFQTVRLVEVLQAGSTVISERRAEELFASLLGDPTPRQLARDQLDTLAVISTPRGEAFDTWVAVAARRGPDPALDAAEATARQRWLATLPVGGRRVAVQRMLAADPQLLPVAEARRRADLLARHPWLGRLLDGLTQVKGRLSAGMAAPAAAGPAVPGAAADWETYAGLSRQLVQGVAAISAGRDFTPLDFPPLTPSGEIRSRLAPRQLILSFHWTKSGLFGALESRDRTAVWQVRQVAGLPGEVQQLARALGLFDANAAVPSDRLADGDWRGAAAAIERILLENSKVTLGDGIDELVIVPDGWLWYVPFELLPATTNQPAAGQPAGEVPLLRDTCRIRYAPTRSLAVMPAAAGRPDGTIGLRAGKLYRGDKPAVAEQFAAEFGAAFDRVLPVAAQAGGPPVLLLASLCDDLVISEELAGEGPLARRPLIGPTPAGPGITFADWVTAPTKRPRRMMLPGFQSAIATGFDRVPERPGEDLFLAATGLVAAGAQTAVLSRWRTGGRVATELVSEFMRDVSTPAQPAPSESWRRAVDVVTPEALDPAREPRIKQVAKRPLADAKHPFFWAGYMLIDCGAGRQPDAVAGGAPPKKP
jgi:tetratricopeptide (TPR) repeat protein